MRSTFSKMKRVLLPVSIGACRFSLFSVAIYVVDFVTAESVGYAKLNWMGVDIVAGGDSIVFVMSGRASDVPSKWVTNWSDECESII